MAFYFSRRKLRPKEKEEMGELNIVPYLDILMNLIIFMLLSITGLVTFGILNVNAPSYGAGVQGPGEDPSQPKLLLTVGISNKGFYVAATGGVLGQQSPEGAAAAPGQGEPTIPKLPDGSFDYAALSEQMVNIKQAFPNETKVIIAAQSEVQYEALVATMDACRETTGPSRRVLFPDVTLGAF
ncbi:MAG: biopolymer transporter ExbD [Myxococcales bacterium]|nr:biopolymer transporter ExbD [Myxococcales bacterium]